MDLERLKYGTALPSALLDTIQRGTMAYSYKGIQTFKNPFDWALYPKLLWETKPATIVEVGSDRGGSALWLADTMRAFGVPCHIHSVDIHRVTDLQASDVTFYGGNARDLSSVFSPEFMTNLKRPLFVIEDADHQAETTFAVLRFFDPWLRPSEYILVEDGIVTDMGQAQAYNGGPRLAIESFLSLRGADYEIDTAYCDWFGCNVTWNVNGFLRRVR
jgi:cephalosporin hydroxylase